MSSVEVEFSRPLRVEQIPANGMEMDLSAKPVERTALARRFQLQTLDSLTATVRLRSVAGGTLVRLSGSLTAKVVQTCVISLEPVPQDVAATFTMSFSADTPDTVPGTELELSVDDEDPPDPIIGGAIDVGEVVAEQLALALDPFPRKAGIAFQEAVETVPEPEKRPSPFAVLAELRKNKG